MMSIHGKSYFIFRKQLLTLSLAGKRTIGFNGKNTKTKEEHVKPQYKQYVASDFSRILNEDPDASWMNQKPEPS